MIAVLQYFSGDATPTADIIVPAILVVPCAVWAHGAELLVPWDPMGIVGPLGPWDQGEGTEGGRRTAGGRQRTSAEHRNINRNNNIGQRSKL